LNQAQLYSCGNW